jgi:hypothetical protein
MRLFVRSRGRDGLSNVKSDEFSRQHPLLGASRRFVPVGDVVEPVACPTPDGVRAGLAAELTMLMRALARSARSLGVTLASSLSSSPVRRSALGVGVLALLRSAKGSEAGPGEQMGEQRSTDGTES